MNAGTVSVEITADMSKLDSGLAAAKSQTVKSATQTGSAFGEQFTKTWGEQSKSLIGQFVGPMMAQAAAKAIAGFLRSDKSTPEALGDALKTIPFVGAFVDLGEAIYDATFGAADKAADDLIAKADAARAGLLAMRGIQAQEERAAGAAADALRMELARLQMEDELQAARATGDEAAIARAEAALKLRQLEFELQVKIGNQISDVELNALLQLNAEKRKAIAAEEALRLASIAKAAAKEKEAADKAAADERKRIAEREMSAEDSLRRARDELGIAQAERAGDTQGAQRLSAERDRQNRAAERDKALRDAATENERRAIRERFAIEQETADLREEAAAAAERAANTTGTAQTALGAFTFDAYPDTDKRRNDERLVKATETMAANLQGQGIY